MRKSAAELAGCQSTVRLRLSPSPTDFGVDQGVANLTVTSDGEVLPGKTLPGTIKNNGHVQALRDRRYRQRKRLQNKGTSSARRRLRALSGRESRMMTDVNHQISKHVVREAERAGIAFVLVDPAYTSQTCPNCGHVSKRNRPARGTFRCQACGFAGHADHIAAINTTKRGQDVWGAINRPHATGLPSPRRAPESKPRRQPTAVDDPYDNRDVLKVVRSS